MIFQEITDRKTFSDTYYMGRSHPRRDNTVMRAILGK